MFSFLPKLEGFYFLFFPLKLEKKIHKRVLYEITHYSTWSKILYTFQIRQFLRPMCNKSEYRKEGIKRKFSPQKSGRFSSSILASDCISIQSPKNWFSFTIWYTNQIKLKSLLNIFSFPKKSFEKRTFIFASITCF